MGDPLKVLREYATGSRNMRAATQNGERFVIFGDVAYQTDVRTNLTVYGKQNEYYSLESLLLLWEQRELAHAGYVKVAAGKSVRAVTRPDRKEIIEYLRGERNDYPTTFDRMAPIAPSIPASRFQEFEGPERKKPKLDGSVKPRIDELLKEGGSAMETSDSSDIRALNDALTADKIAALKKKMKNHQKRTTTAATDDLEMEVGGDVPRIDSEMKKKERVWKTRVNCLEANSKQFTLILGVLQSLKTREDTEMRNKAYASGAPPSATRGDSRSAQRKSNVGYSRYDQEQFSKEQMELGIEPEMSFVGSNLKAINDPNKHRTPSIPVPSSHRPSMPVRDHSSTPSTNAGTDTPKKRTSRTPIIIIPANTNANSLISMYNVRDVLQEMKFVTSEDRKSQMRRENETLIQRRKGGTTVPYRVVDNPGKLTPEEWDRVVAVFAMGPAWQFKGWNWQGNPVNIFSQVAGFHLTYDSIKLDQNVAKWSVRVIALSKDKRHLDKARLQIFWDTLDRHIAKNKPHLRF